MTDRAETGDAETIAGRALLHAELVRLLEALELRIDAATTAAQVDETAAEIRRVNRRVTALGAAVLGDRTEVLMMAAAAIRDALPAIDEAIEDAEAAHTIARKVGAALELVDAALDTAQRLG